MRVQTRCALTVRFTWAVDAGHSHPEHTFGCVEDRAMAITAALHAAVASPRGLALVAVHVSPTGGRYDPWEPLELEFSEDRSSGWLSGACTK